MQAKHQSSLVSPFGSLKNFERNLFLAGPAGPALAISLERSWGCSLSEVSWYCGDPLGDRSVELTKMSSEPLEKRLESENDEVLLVGQERSSGWIWISTMSRVLTEHWCQSQDEELTWLTLPGKARYHCRHSLLLLSIDLIWLNMEFLNCKRSKSWWIRLFNLAYWWCVCLATCKVSYTVWYSCDVWWRPTALQVRTLRTVLAYWTVSWDILCHSFMSDRGAAGWGLRSWSLPPVKAVRGGPAFLGPIRRSDVRRDSGCVLPLTTPGKLWRPIVCLSYNL